jgi:Ser/Thr protein kinase RdoA (MazF antagonist)
MNTSQDWIEHYSPIDKELEKRFINLSEKDCYDVLKLIDQPLSDGKPFESTENRVFGFNDVVIKFYHPGRWSYQALKEEVIFLEDLRDAKVPFVRPIGDVGTWKDINYIVFEMIKGPLVENRKIMDEESVRKMTHIVAKVHEVGAKRDAPSRAQFNPRAMSSGCFEVIQRAGFLPKDLNKRYQQAIDELIKSVEQIGNIPIQRIHGDTYSGNILWKDNNPIFMDLDDFQVGPIALDVRLLSFPWRLDTLSESMDRRERRKIQHNMVLEMYREVSSFSEKQEKVLPLLGAYRDIQFDAWFSARWNDPGFAESYSEDDITSSEYWVDSIEGLEHSIYNS